MTVANVTATIHVKLKPWSAPNFALRADREEGTEAASIAVADLDPDALEDMALAWVEDLYRKAGKRSCPFYKSAKCGTAG